MTFNATKSKCIVIGNKRRANCPLPVFTLNGNLIEYVDSWPHLGHVISSKLIDDDDILNRRCVMFGQINRIICNFNCLDFNLKCKLFNTYCSSHYGCEIWDLNCGKIQEYCTGWRRGLRRFLDLPYDFSTILLHVVSKSLPVFDIIIRRSLNFIVNCLNSESNIVKFMARFCINFAGTSSIFGRNIVECMHFTRMPLHRLLNVKINCHPAFNKFYSSISCLDQNLAQSAQEIISIKEGIFEVDGQTWDHSCLQDCLRSLSFSAHSI